MKQFCLSIAAFIVSTQIMASSSYAMKFAVPPSSKFAIRYFEDGIVSYTSASDSQIQSTKDIWTKVSRSFRNAKEDVERIVQQALDQNLNVYVSESVHPYSGVTTGKIMISNYWVDPATHTALTTQW